MKRSLWSLVYALIFTFYYPLILVVRMISKQPETISPYGYGMNYSITFLFLIILLLNLAISIVGSICAWIAYRKNKYKLVLFTVILSLLSVMSFLVIPVYLIVAIPLLGLGIMSYTKMRKGESFTTTDK